MKKPPRIPMRTSWWATVRTSDGSVCLWETRKQAHEGKEPDERVARVRLIEVTK